MWTSGPAAEFGERGYCLIIGGDAAVVRRLDPVFATLAPSIETALRTPGRETVGGTAEHGYLHCGPSGAGHFVKMVHNGIGYGIMAAYAEGLNMLHHANVGTQERPVDAEITPWRHPEHYAYDLNLAEVAGRVPDSGEGRWTHTAAIDASVLAPVLSGALFERFSSRDEGDFADKVLSALRYQFGGHEEKAAVKKGDA